jgi:gamma-glutamylcyclotransferase (GGCT)/AIG2-like uncharacterized protein YtfP
MSVVFAYGSNLDLRQMAARCPRARSVGRAFVQGYRLGFAGWSHRWGGAVATLVRARGHRVPGALYEVDRHDLAALDRFEGCPGVYERRRVFVTTSRGGRRWAEAYVLRGGPMGRPSFDYLVALHIGYLTHGLDRALLPRLEPRPQV